MDYIIANPPYNKGGNIMKKVFEKFKDAQFSILMPASCYLKDDFYKNINSAERADNLFDAAIQKNNLICTLSKEENGWTKEDFFLHYCDPKFKEVYKWNIEHFRGLIPVRCDGKPLDEFDIDLDFIEHARSVAYNAGNGFGPGGGGYMFNVLKDIKLAKEHNPSLKFCIHFEDKESKDNFSKWWYYGRKMKSLSSLLMTGTGMLTLAEITRYAIPQIDWKEISNSETWKKGLLDKAVLETMAVNISI